MMLRPYGYGDPLMEVAFRDFVLFAYDIPAFRQAFKADTGFDLDDHPKNGLEKMIDDATGINDERAKAFIEWLIKAHWGEANYASR